MRIQHASTMLALIVGRRPQVSHQICAL